MKTAILSIKAGSPQLTLIDVNFHEPVADCEYEYFSYKDKVGIRTIHHGNGKEAVIKTMPGTGKGQLKAFDELVGERIARLRKSLAKEGVEYAEFIFVKGELGAIKSRVRRYAEEECPLFFRVGPSGMQLCDAFGASM